VTIGGTAYHFLIAQLPASLPQQIVQIFIRRGFLRRLLHLFVGVYRFDTIQTHFVEQGGLEHAISFAERQIAKAHQKGLESSTAEGFPGPERSRSAARPDPPAL
jgi:hypothetical protein